MYFVCFFFFLRAHPGGENGFNIPQVKACPEVGRYLSLSEEELSRVDPSSWREPARRLLCDSYMCLYHSPELSLYKWYTKLNIRFNKRVVEWFRCCRNLKDSSNSKQLHEHTACSTAPLLFYPDEQTACCWNVNLPLPLLNCPTDGKAHNECTILNLLKTIVKYVPTEFVLYMWLLL